MQGTSAGRRNRHKCIPSHNTCKILFYSCKGLHNRKTGVIFDYSHLCYSPLYYILLYFQSSTSPHLRVDSQGAWRSRRKGLKTNLHSMCSNLELLLVVLINFCQIMSKCEQPIRLSCRLLRKKCMNKSILLYKSHLFSVLYMPVNVSSKPKYVVELLLTLKGLGSQWRQGRKMERKLRILIHQGFLGMVG